MKNPKSYSSFAANKRYHRRIQLLEAKQLDSGGPSIAKLMMTSATVAMVATPQNVAFAQTVDCGDLLQALPDECVQPNATTAVSVPSQPNTEYEAAAVSNNSGFVFSIDGQAVNADPQVIAPIRQTDIQLERADVRVTFDGLGAKPRLDLEYANQGNGNVTFQSRTNYPGFIQRAEIRLIDKDALGGPRLVGVVPVDANGQATASVDPNGNIIAVHRVYDAQGRFDETKPVSLSGSDARGLVAGVEDGTDNTASRRIPVRGGAVTVSSNNVQPGSTVATLGEVVRPSGDGSFVIQRILPPGEYDIDVDVNGPASQEFSRRIDIPNSEWFYTAIADVTIGMRSDSLSDDDEFYSRARIAGYANGLLANGTEITASVDTQEEEIEDLFSNLDEKDPRQVIARVDPYSVYRVFGDDSTSVDDTPTSGRIYLKIERDNNYFLWGDYKNDLGGNDFVRNDRSLYGAQAQIASQSQTSAGDPRFKLQAYAAQPDTLADRDVFLGTGGTLYFLSHQDVNQGSTTVAIEVRDSTTDRVIDRQVLVEGVDYTINNLQGSILLKKPLSASADEGLIEIDAGGDNYVNLVANYEYSPTSADTDSFAYGGRAEAWLTDNIRVGASGLSEETEGQDDQKLYGADALVKFGERSEISVDYAKSEGPGFGSSYSTDGGLIVDTVDPTGGEGEAYSVDARVDLQDLGLQNEGFVSGYYQFREEGFTSADYSVGSDTGDETLWGLATQVQINPQLLVRFSYDNYENAQDEFDRTAKADVTYDFNDRLSATLGASYVDRQNANEVGTRTDLAGRLDYEVNDQLAVYIFAQGAVDGEGLEENNRAGIGGKYQINDNWDFIGEVYGSDLGVGGKALVNYQSDNASSLYFGYERDPARSIGLSDAAGDDLGRFTFGGSQRVSDKVTHFTESRYDLFSEGMSLTGAYGVSYQQSAYLRHELAVEGGRVIDPENGNLDRMTVSLGTYYEDDKLSARVRAEYRQDRGEDGEATNRDADVFILNTEGRYKFNEDSRLGFGLSIYDTQTDQSDILDGQLIDGHLSYAYRPVDNDKLNLLFGYRYYYDMYGQRVDGDDDNRIRQKSHVFSIDGEYEIDDKWTVGAKLGGRLSETSPDQTSAFVENNAILGVATARYHVVQNWDILAEGRVLQTYPDGSTDLGFVGAVYRHIGNNMKIGVGYNFGSFSDDLTDLTYDDQGAFINFVAKF